MRQETSGHGRLANRAGV